jgi:hypothetical protein
MKPSELKSFIKEAVREAIQEELKDILLEAVRAPKAPVIETPVGGEGFGVANTSTSPAKSPAERKAVMESIMGDMRRGQDTLNFTSANAVTADTLQVAPV